MSQLTPTMLPPHTATTPTPRPARSDYALPDLTDDEWVLVANLLSAGVTPQRLLHLIRLRSLYRCPRTAALDGYIPDSRTRFARWLVQRGLLNEGS